MAKVRTVTGDIDPNKLGIALTHEHLFFDMGRTHDQERIVDLSGQIREVEWFKEQGGDCIVDQTTIDLGRQPDLLRRLAEATGLHIIGSTGYYHEPWLPAELLKKDVDAIAETFVHDIEEGVPTGSYRAGLIGEIGSTETGTTELEEKVLRAAGRAHRATGAPISTHTMAGAEAVHQIAILKEEGVDPHHVIVSHLDLDHVEHIRIVAEQGVFLGFDTIGKPRYKDQYRHTGDDIRLEVLCAIIGAGYESQILLSHDISRVRYLRAQGGKGYGHLLSEFVPRMRKRLSESTIENLLIHNPRRALAF